MGTPVIAARCPATLEVGGPAIRYFEPGDVAGLRRRDGAASRGDPAARAALATAGLARAAGVHAGGRAPARTSVAYTLACR